MQYAVLSSGGLVALAFGGYIAICNNFNLLFVSWIRLIGIGPSPRNVPKIVVYGSETSI